MRHPITDRGRRPAGSFLRGKQLSHVLILVIAFTAAAYGVVREAAPSTALESSTGQIAVVGGTEPLDQQTALDSTPQATAVRASGAGTTTRPAEATPTSKGQATSEAANAEGTPSVEPANAGPSAAAGAPTATMTAEERIRSLMVTPIATPGASGTPRAGGTPGATSTPTPTATPEPSCEPSESAAYCIYTVAEGDTLSSLAARFGLENKDLLGWELLAASNKPDITDVNVLLQPGQKLRIPTKSGLVHTVIFAETVGELADIFDVTSASIIDANGLSNADLLQPGQVLLIPNPKRLEAPPPPAPEPTPEPETPNAPPSAPEQSRPSRPVSSAGFIWPVTASVKITSTFGPRHPLGIDLGLAHAARSSIVAVADGKVIFAGGNACCSYGLYVIVQHASGLQTLYGHLSRLDVRTGQTVSQGDSLGPSGSTGYSTGFHLHFEVSKNGVRLNPMNYLPAVP